MHEWELVIEWVGEGVREGGEGLTVHSKTTDQRFIGFLSPGDNFMLCY